MPQTPENEAPLHDFVAALRAAWTAEDRPLNAHLDVTYRCDLDCGHCYLDNKTTWPELTTSEWFSVLEQLHEAGVMFLVWSGGDVLMRSDFAELLSKAASLGLMSRVKTHGGQVDATWAAHFAANKVGRMDVSVFSLRPEIHDALTRRPGSLHNTLRGIAAAREAGVRVKVSCWVQPTVIDEIGQICQYFEDLGCEVTFDTRTMLDHSASPQLAHLQLAGEDLVRARVAILHAQPTIRPRRLAERSTAEPCSAGRTLVYISPDGELWPCINFPMSLGNLRETPLLQIWRESAARKSLVAWNNNDRATCQTCSGSGFCFYCPGDAYKTTGDFRKAPGHFHAEARAKMLAWEQVNGEAFTPDDWASVPDESERRPTGQRFVFPIHRAKRGAGARVAGGK
jgi:radical SAM protein with 4Fe4S-binding SPASM domain